MKPFSHQLLSPKIYLLIFHILLESKYLEFGFMAPSLLKSSLGVPAPNWVSPTQLPRGKQNACRYIQPVGLVLPNRNVQSKIWDLGPAT
jgi:hypothetical protein